MTASTPPASNQWRDWATIGLRLLLVLGVALGVWLWRVQIDATGSQQDVLIMAAVGVASALLLALLAATSSMRAAMPYATVVVDWVLAGALIYFTDGDPLVFAMVVGVLIGAGMLYLGTLVGSFQAVGVLAAALGVLIYVHGAESLSDQVPVYTLPLMLALVPAVGLTLWTYFFEQYGSVEQRELHRLSEARTQEIADMKQRWKALTEMINTLSGTHSYEKVLDAALDIGHLTLHDDDRQRIVSIVLLFDNSSEQLFVANSRGLSHMDEARTIRGREGIVAQAQEDLVPVIGADPTRDPELRQFGSMQGQRSVICVPLRARFDNYGVLIYTSSSRNAFDEGLIDALTAIGVQAAVALQNAVLYDSLREEKERIIQMEEDARKALVRDLHDIPTQTISAVAMRIRIIRRLLDTRPDEVPIELETLESMALRATEEIRHVLFKLRPLALESQGLVAALKQLAEKMQATYKQNVQVKVKSEVERYLDSHEQGAVFYLIEEAVNNARKYAEASLITVQGLRHKDTIAIRIADNGTGFDTDDVSAGYDTRGSFGMVNMRERAELLDGTLKVESKPGQGTAITVIIPIDPNRVVEDSGPAVGGRSRLAASTWSKFNQEYR